MDFQHLTSLLKFASLFRQVRQVRQQQNIRKTVEPIFQITTQQQRQSADSINNPRRIISFPSNRSKRITPPTAELQLCLTIAKDLMQINYLPNYSNWSFKFVSIKSLLYLQYSLLQFVVTFVSSKEAETVHYQSIDQSFCLL